MDNISIRKARKFDGKEAIDVLRHSIAELCDLDHKNDASEIADWLSNKTVLSWNTWIDRDDATVYIAEKNDQIVLYR